MLPCRRMLSFLTVACCPLLVCNLSSALHISVCFLQKWTSKIQTSYAIAAAQIPQEVAVTPNDLFHGKAKHVHPRQ